MEGCFTAPSILSYRARVDLFFHGKAICVPTTCYSVFWTLGTQHSWPASLSGVCLLGGGRGGDECGVGSVISA